MSTLASLVLDASVVLINVFAVTAPLEPTVAPIVFTNVQYTSRGLVSCLMRSVSGWSELVFRAQALATVGLKHVRHLYPHRRQVCCLHANLAHNPHHVAVDPGREVTLSSSSGWTIIVATSFISAALISIAGACCAVSSDCFSLDGGGVVRFCSGGVRMVHASLGSLRQFEWLRRPAFHYSRVTALHLC